MILDAVNLGTTIGDANTKTYDLLSQVSVFENLDYTYQQRDHSDLTNNTALLARLNEEGILGKLFLGDKQLDLFFGPKATYVKTNLSQTFAYQLRTDAAVTSTTLVNILNEQGKQGCRFVESRLQGVATNTRATICVNNNRHNGVFDYRYLPYPESTRADALKALLDTQRNEGFYPIRVLTLNSTTTPQILFERDSVVEDVVKFIQYKIFSQALPNNQPELTRLLDDQGKIGWHFWSQITHPSNNHGVSIFASSPFYHLPEGEAVVLNPR